MFYRFYFLFFCTLPRSFLSFFSAITQFFCSKSFDSIPFFFRLCSHEIRCLHYGARSLRNESAHNVNSKRASARMQAVSDAHHKMWCSINIAIQCLQHILLECAQCACVHYATLKCTLYTNIRFRIILFPYLLSHEHQKKNFVIFHFKQQQRNEQKKISSKLKNQLKHYRKSPANRSFASHPGNNRWKWNTSLHKLANEGTSESLVYCARAFSILMAF